MIGHSRKESGILSGVGGLELTSDLGFKEHLRDGQEGKEH